MPVLYKILEDGTEEFKERGGLVQAIAWNEDRTFKEVVGSKPTIGCSVLVGSVTARTFASQDYWLTTEVTEILEEEKTEDGLLVRVKFKTTNSIYELRT